MNEPVAYIKDKEIAYMLAVKQDGAKEWRTNLGLYPEDGDVPLYTAPQKQESQAPVGSVADTDLQGFIAGDCSHILVYPKGSYPEGGVDLHTAPPKREWIGLTKEEFFEIYHSPATIIKQMSMIEAKLKEKNE